MGLPGVRVGQSACSRRQPAPPLFKEPPKPIEASPLPRNPSRNHLLSIPSAFRGRGCLGMSLKPQVGVMGGMSDLP